MEPVFMVLGQSAATAGVLAMKDGIPVQEVRYDKLRKELLEDGQALDLPPDAKPHRVFDISRMPGVVVDDAGAELAGEWKTSTAGKPFLGTGYRHDDNADQGAKSAVFTAKLPKAGRYEVRISYPPNPESGQQRAGDDQDPGWRENSDDRSKENAGARPTSSRLPGHSISRPAKRPSRSPTRKRTAT